jgi:phage I-like protein
MNDSQTKQARETVARMAQPLTREELEVCQKLGITEAVFKAERDREIAKALPGWHAGMEHGLTAGEAEAAAALGMTLETYARAKAGGAA